MAVYVVFYLAARRFSLELLQLAIASVFIVLVGWAVGAMSALSCLLCFVGGGAVWRLQMALAGNRLRTLIPWVAAALMVSSLYAHFETAKDQFHLRFLLSLFVGFFTVFTFSSDAVKVSPRLEHLFSQAGFVKYASYLLHFPLQLLAVLILPQWVFGSALFWPRYLIVIWAVAWHTYRCFELPAQNALRALFQAA